MHPVSEPSRVRADALAPGTVGRAGRWAVAHQRDGRLDAVSARCRHQLGDLSKGTLDADGCLVCPWHGARYDLDSGQMVSGPHGFLVYVGRTPGYTRLIEAFGRVARLRRRAVARVGEHFVVGR